MEIVRYIIVFFTVGWGSGIIGVMLFFLFLPILSPLRGTTAGRGITAASNGGATLIAVYLANLACTWTGGEASYLMFGVAFWAMLSNDLWRIRRAKSAYSMAGQVLDESPALRLGIIHTEQMNTVADVIGFVIGLAIISRLDVV